MKRSLLFSFGSLAAVAIAAAFYFIPGVSASINDLFKDDPDIGKALSDYKSQFTKEEFMLKRAENIAMYRGLGGPEPVDPELRIDAIHEMERAEREVTRNDLAPQAAWVEIGPNPIPNAQVNGGPVTTASGRTISIAVHPTNANLVYVGTAQGGLYRSTDGGTNWTRMMDSAQSLAIGAIAIAPSQPDTLYIGTGEQSLSCDSYFGVGIYRIDNASTGSPILTGPFGIGEFLGRAVGEIVVHPTDPATIFATSTSGVTGLSCLANNLVSSRGLFRSTNATTTMTFTKLTVAAAGENLNMVDLAMEPDNADRLLVSVIGSAVQSGVWISTNATVATPVFARTLALAGTTTNTARTELAIADIGGVVTVFAATANGAGQVHRSTSGGDLGTWTQQIDNNFCNPQCFYDIAIDVDPTNASNVYIGGSPVLVFGRSTNGGTTFTNNATTALGLHVDSHAIEVAPSAPATIYFGSDGGIYKTTDSGTTWASLNNSQFTATQFMGLAVHPTDHNFTVGGTQDNGTNWFQPAGTWTRADFGDGGYAVIDQNATDTTNVRVYHTYFNQPGAMGYARSLTTATMSDGLWTLHGCGFMGSIANGMTCTDPNVLFYAPMEQGPGAPLNTVYFGSNVLYRSSDGGATMAKVSQQPIAAGAAISAIGIAPTNDNVRIVGLETGGVFGTTTGSSTLVDLDLTFNTIPNTFVARAVISPADVNTAYISLAAYGVTNVWKTTNLNNGGGPTWTAASTGLPQIPVNGFVIDPLNADHLYAGTDIGVYNSTDAGATWNPFGTGLPRVAVFDVAIAPGTPRMLRIATHGRGLWQTPLFGTTAANVGVSGRVFSALGSGISRATVSVTDSQGNTRTTLTNPFGYYRFDDLASGQTYAFAVRAKGYSFQPQIVTVADELTDLDFIAGK